VSGRLPETMRAAVYRGDRNVAVERRALPEIGPRDVLIEVSHCGICGTDLHLVLEGMGRPDSIGGHEYAGRIAALGAEVEGWAPGDPVVGGPAESCGMCAHCDAGRPSLCAERPGFALGFQGAFAEYKRVDVSQLLRVPEGLALGHAALAEPLAVALHALTLSAVRPGERVLVTGAGPLGLLVVAALRARGVGDVRVSEPAPLRRERAGKVGGTHLLVPEGLSVPTMPYDVVADPVDVVFECSGAREAVESGVAQLERRGRIVLVGTGMRRPRLDANRVLLNELVLTGAYEYDAGGMAEALELLAAGRLPNDELVDPERVPLEALLDAMHGLAAGERTRKVMVVPKETR
jgi:2-desacetyl-2-hydroxyethyl bacteriochlorophyllide A dehydrogenase